MGLTCIRGHNQHEHHLLASVSSPGTHTYGDHCSKLGPFHVTDRPSCFYFCRSHNKQDTRTTDSLTRILNTVLFFGLFCKTRFKSLCCPEWQSSKVLGCKDKVLFHHQIPNTLNVRTRRHSMTDTWPKCFKRYSQGKSKRP